jgi:hypothetical protein
MKSCPVCLDSVDVNASRCPSCGERFFTPVAQSFATPTTPKPTVIEPKPAGVRSRPKINPLVKLYTMVFLAIAVLAAGALLVLNNNSANNGGTGVSSPTSPSEEVTPEPSVDETKEEKQDYVLASSILEKLTQAGVCDAIGLVSGPGAAFYTDDMYRSCYIESESGMGDKFVSIYTGPILSSRYTDLDGLKVFEVSIIGDGWTVVTNFYPAQGKTYLDDVDIKAILKLLGGRIIARND